MTFPGSTNTITANGQSTTSWVYTFDQPVAVRILGTWVGTLAFEISTNGGSTWNAITLNGTSTASSVTGNGTWRGDNAAFDPPGIFRVRATSWTSGAATVYVGMRGGESAAFFDAGNFTSLPTRIYTRTMLYVDPAWNNNGNTGTKFFFLKTSASPTNNHYVGAWGETSVFTGVGTQFNSSPGDNADYSATINTPLGTWADIEWVMEANTPGTANGIFKTWINGTQVSNRADVIYFLSGQTAGFSALSCDPTFGGGENPPRSNQIIQLAMWYRESAA